MSDDGWEGLHDESADYTEYLTSPASAVGTPAPAPTPVGPLVSPLQLGGTSPGASAPRPPSASRRGLGDFSPVAVCELRSLAKLSYLFLNNVSLGDTSKALGALGVFRYLFNDSRNTIAAGFTPQVQAILPVSIPDVSWSQPMQVAMGLTLVAAGGQSNTALRDAIGRMPGNMAALAGWFPTFRAALAPGDIAMITDYASQAIITSMDYARQVAQFATDDLRACLPASAPSPSGTAPPSTGGGATYQPSGSGSSITTTASTIRCSDGSIVPVGTPCPPPAAAGPASGGSNLLVIGFLALVGYGGYLTWKDAKDKKSGAMGALPSGKSWLPRDLGARAAEFDRLNRRAQKTGADDGRKVAKDVECIPTPTTKRSFSMDEWGGPGAEKLNSAIVRLSEQVKGARPDLSQKLRHDVEHELEDTYFQAYTASLRANGARAGNCE